MTSPLQIRLAVCDVHDGYFHEDGERPDRVTRTGEKLTEQRGRTQAGRSQNTAEVSRLRKSLEQRVKGEQTKTTTRHVILFLEMLKIFHKKVLNVL